MIKPRLTSLFFLCLISPFLRGQEFKVILNDTAVNMVVLGPPKGFVNYQRVSGTVPIKIDNTSKYIVVISKEGYNSSFFVINKTRRKLKEYSVPSLQPLSTPRYNLKPLVIDTIQYYLMFDYSKSVYSSIDKYLAEQPLNKITEFTDDLKQAHALKKRLKGVIDESTVLNHSMDPVPAIITCHVNRINRETITVKYLDEQGRQGYKILNTYSVLIKWIVKDYRFISPREKVIIKLVSGICDLSDEQNDPSGKNISSLNKSHIDINSLVEFSLRELLPELATIDELKPQKKETDFYTPYSEKNTLTLDTSYTKGKKSLESSEQCIVLLKNGKVSNTGCIISKDGYIVSTAQILKGDSSKTFLVDFTKDTIPVDLAYADKENNLVLFKAGKKFDRCFQLDMHPPLVGEEMILRGVTENVFYKQSISKGIVSGMRKIDGKKYIQTDAAINSGNEGGAAINENGDLVGIISQAITKPGMQGLGFIIPMDQILVKLIDSCE